MRLEVESYISFNEWISVNAKFKPTPTCPKTKL